MGRRTSAVPASAADGVVSPPRNVTGLKGKKAKYPQICSLMFLSRKQKAEGSKAAEHVPFTSSTMYCGRW